MVQEIRAKGVAVVSEQVPTAKSIEEFDARIEANPKIMEAFFAGDPQGVNDFFEKVWGGRVTSITERTFPE
jgi:hypothetical protein